MYTLGNRALSSEFVLSLLLPISPAMENEITKCMKSLLVSQRSSLASLAPMLCPVFTQLLQVGLPDVPRGTVIQCFGSFISSPVHSVLLTMTSPTAGDELFSALGYLLSYCFPFSI